ncbi:hypothetical protein BKA70DRAFT_1290849 [Coprinopsis sp. MPI-PUGE-AT-0042]|nr:hypothetical protein BKA70DRAFT_1290849 [Coprinopsis sp. MPI-PUGE-AT-0042]
MRSHPCLVGDLWGALCSGTAACVASVRTLLLCFVNIPSPDFVLGLQNAFNLEYLSIRSRGRLGGNEVTQFMEWLLREVAEPPRLNLASIYLQIQVYCCHRDEANDFTSSLRSSFERPSLPSAPSRINTHSSRCEPSECGRICFQAPRGK